MKIGAYCRVSTEKEEQIESLKNQKEFFEQFCQQQGHELVKIYADEGISGKQMRKRKEFLKMIADAKSRDFDVVAVKDVTRFARNTVDFLEVIRDLKAHGIKVIFINHNMDSMDGSEFILTIFAAAAQDDSARLSSRVKFGKDLNAKKGRVPNLVYGYDKVDTFNLNINEKEAQVVRKIFSLYISGEYGATKIAIYLNERGIRTKRQGEWYSNSVTRVLRNELYLGRVINKKSEVVDFITGQRKVIKEDKRYIMERPAYRIVEDEVFRKAQHILKERIKSFNLEKKRISLKYPLSNLVYCAHCGYSFRRSKRQYASTGKAYIKWRCSKRNALGKNACDNRLVLEEEEVIKYINQYFMKTFFNINRIEQRLEATVKKELSIRNKGTIEAGDIKQEQKALQNKLRKYIELYTEELISKEEFQRLSQGIKQRIEDSEKKLRVLENLDYTQEDIKRSISQLKASADNSLYGQSFTNEELKQLIDQINVEGRGSLKIKLKSS